MDEIDYLKIDEKYETGTIKEDDTSKVCPFDKYKVEVKLDSNGKFLGIIGISINKDFRSFMQKMNNTGYIDLSKYYPEESE